MFKLIFEDDAKDTLQELERDPSQIIVLKAVRKALGNLERDPFYPGLNTDRFEAWSGPNGEKIFESYAQNKTPGAYRIFWMYGEIRKQIKVVLITPHP